MKALLLEGGKIVIADAAGEVTVEYLVEELGIDPTSAMLAGIAVTGATYGSLGMIQNGLIGNGQIQSEVGGVESKGGAGVDTKTGTVWDNITATQDNWSNTQIPRSFEVEVNGQKMWVHGNATEHMYDDVCARIVAGEGTAYTNPDLYTQELMSDFYGSLEQATASGIKYGELIPAGNWEFIFVLPRQEGLLPVIKHAQFNGW